MLVVCSWKKGGSGRRGCVLMRGSSDNDQYVYLFE
jgi:hypothetical protein